MLSVGKTSVLLRYVHNTFEDRISRFISEERKAIRIQNQEILLNLWDTAGQERFQSITNRFYADTHGVLIVYDASTEDGYHELDFWVKEVNYYLPRELENGLPVMFVGNKIDLLDSGSQDQAKSRISHVHELANAHSFLKPMECSAKTGEGVSKIFETMGKVMLSRKTNAGPLGDAPTVRNVTRGGGCCQQ
eukprot:Em0014g29a